MNLYTKPEIAKLWDDLLDSKMSLYAWARHTKVKPSDLILSMLKHYPEKFEARPKRLEDIKKGDCKWCDDEFYANVNGQEFCDKTCQRRHWENTARDQDGKNYLQRKGSSHKKVKSGDEKDSPR